MSNQKKLRLIYDNRQNDFVVTQSPSGRDSALIMNHLLLNMLEYRFGTEERPCPNNFEITNFIKELESRGYDPKTLKFSIELKSK